MQLSCREHNLVFSLGFTQHQLVLLKETCFGLIFQHQPSLSVPFLSQGHLFIHRKDPTKGCLKAAKRKTRGELLTVTKSCSVPLLSPSLQFPCCVLPVLPRPFRGAFETEARAEEALESEWRVRTARTRACFVFVKIQNKSKIKLYLRLFVFHHSRRRDIFNAFFFSTWMFCSIKVKNGFSVSRAQ